MVPQLHFQWTSISKCNSNWFANLYYCNAKPLSRSRQLINQSYGYVLAVPGSGNILGMMGGEQTRLFVPSVFSLAGIFRCYKQLSCVQRSSRSPAFFGLCAVHLVLAMPFLVQRIFLDTGYCFSLPLRCDFLSKNCRI